MKHTHSRSMRKKLLALVLAVIMVMCLMPVSAFAEEGQAEAGPQAETVEPAAVDAEETAEPEEPVAEEPEEEPVEDAVEEETIEARDTSEDGFIRIFHLDCGRKYFSVSEIKGIIDQLAQNHFTHMQLAFGNNGFRFLLDDMSITANDKTYSSADVTSAIKSGNSSYSSGKSTDSSMLSESDMNKIISYATEKNISIIPMLNTPGHMDALVSAMRTLGIRSSTGSEMDLSSSAEVGFIKALQQKYIEYFSAKGSDHYNLAADEYSFSGLSNEDYTSFAQYVNDVASMVKRANMTPMAYNDGFYYSGKTTSVDFDTDIQICYWSQAGNYASVTDLDAKGFKIINNNDAWYYVLGNYLYKIWSSGQWGYQDAIDGLKNTPVTQAKNAADKEIDLAGSVLCCWCDGPSEGWSSTNSKSNSGLTNQQEVYNLISTMAQYNPEYFKASSGSDADTPEITAPKSIALDSDKDGVTLTSSIAAKWTSSDEGVVKLEAAAQTRAVTEYTTSVKAIPVSAGTAEITATTENNKTASFTIEVKETAESGLTEKKITVTVGGTATDTIEGANYAGTYTTEDPGIATVTVTGEDATQGTYSSVRVAMLNLCGGNVSNWTKTNYFYKNGNNYYPVYAHSENYYYYYGYSKTDSASDVTSVGEGRFSTYAYLYAKDDTGSTPASTTITFKGVTKGTTTVTIGSVRYTITVQAEDLTKADSLPIQLWITNVSIEVTDKTTKGSGQFNDYNNGGYAYYVTAKADDAYDVNGVPLSQLVPSAIKDKTETSLNDRSATYALWKGTVLNTTTGLQKYWWKDMTQADGRVDYQYVRYYGGEWAVSNDRTHWTTVTGEGSTGASSSCKEQVIAYYMQRTDVTNEVITDVVDWGNTTDKWSEEKPTQYGVLDFAVQYPGGTRIPNSFPVAGKSVYFHCDQNDTTGVVSQDDDSNYYRRIGLINGINTEGYEVYMITVTPTSDTPTDQLTNSSTALTTSTKIEYKGTEKVVWVDDEENLPEEFRSDSAKFHSISGTYNYTVGGAANVAGLEIYQRQGMLVTYYIRPVVTEDSLTVRYIDEAGNNEFYNYNINVKSGTLFDSNIGLDNPWKGPLANGTVENILNKDLTVSADLSTMIAVPAQYRYAVDYTCTRVVRSADGKTVSLYYTFKHEKTFVVDFGLPLTIQPTDISAMLSRAEITGVKVSSQSSCAAVTTDAKHNIVYTLKQALSGADTMRVTYYGQIPNGDGTQSGEVSYTLDIIPASSVYYEDSFVTVNNGTGAAADAKWSTDGETNSTPSQALEALGQKKNVYGYDAAYDNSSTFSMGSAQKVTVSKAMVDGWNDHADSAWPSATFTFKGTGFDVVSLTDNTSGAIFVDVTKGSTKVKSLVVNNYYGYKYENDEWVVDENASNTLYQIPVIKVSGLDYGEYTVTIRAAYSAFFDTAKKDSYSFWLDAIRVYDPMGTDYADYTKDGEGYPQYIKLRNELTSNAVFIDGKENATVAEYKNYGPNNEVYLANSQAITFSVPVSNDIASVQIGAKAPNGGAATMTVDGNVTTLDTATEMYYKIAENGGTFTVTNTGKGLLSLTNLKITYKQAQTAVMSLAALTDSDKEQAVETVRALFAAAPEVKTFTPSRLEASWGRAVREGKTATLTVKASEDVESITVDGQTITNYRTRTERSGWGWWAERVTYREFTYTITAEATADYTITAQNSEGAVSQPVTATLTVNRGGWFWGRR